MSSQSHDPAKNQMPSATDSIHGDFLEKSIPQWLVDAAPQRRKAIKDAGTVLPDWYLNATPEQRQDLNQSFNASATAQARLDKTMSTFKDIDTFAEPLLLKALKDQYAVEVDVNTTLMCLRRSLEVGVLAVELSSFEFLKLTMLQAALHNFEAWECKPGAYHQTSGFMVSTATPGTYAPVAVKLTISQFTTLCRRLDIGAKYQAYLKSFFHPADTRVEATLRQDFIASQKAAMRAAAEQALLTKDIEPGDYAMILSVISGENHPWMGDKQVWFHDMGLMKHRMTGCVGFVICEKYRYNDEVILYIPNDPAHPLKRYSGSRMKQEFKRLFLDRDGMEPGATGPTSYQRFYSQFVPYDQRPYYFSQFTQKSADSPSDFFRSPWITIVEFISPASSLTYIRELPPERPGKMEPVPDPYIAPSTVTRKGRGIWAENVDLWTYLYEQHRDKVIADARSHAVSSDEVDVKAREAKLAHLLQVGLLGVNMVSMFVPVLGEVMMVVMAGQLLYESLEGAIEWSEGDKRAAKAHLVDVAENLALIGVMAGVGVGVGKLTAVKPEPVIENLHPVTLPNGQIRLWKPDLSAYESRVSLDASTGPNALGHHVVGGKTYIRPGGKVYETFFDRSIQKWRIRHPTDTNAYQPILEGNGRGAWRHTLERPMQWDRLDLLRRMGHETEAFSDEALLQVADVSGVTDNALRKMHMDHAAPPPELTDAMRLFNADSGALQVLEQLRGTRSIDNRYLQALPLVTRMPRWPEARVLEVFEGPGLSGKSIKFGTERAWRGDGGKPVIKVSQADVLKGELPTRILAALNESEITRLLGAEGARVRASRAEELGKQFADYAQSRQSAIFDALYKGNEPVDARIKQLQRECPGLSEAAAQEVLAHGSADDLTRFEVTKRPPLKLLEEARWYARQGRQTRAYAGLRSENIASADSRRLALNALENLPGWPDTLRLEVREGSDTGTLLDSIGDENAPVKKYLVKNGPRYQAFNERGETLNSVPREGDNFYASIMHALPDDARSALDLPHVSQASELQRTIIAYADAHRSQAGRMLEPQAGRFKPPVRVNDQLLGYYASGRGRGLDPSLTSRVEVLYPAQAQADAFIRQQVGKTNKQIYSVLETRTRDWQALSWTLDQWTGTPGSSSFHHRTQIAQALKTSWRNAPLSAEVPEAGRLTLFCDEPLPGIDADFSHVHDLTVAGRGLTDANADAFLTRFPNVRKLSIGGEGRSFARLASRSQPLTSLPRTVTEMQQLTNLTLSSGAHTFAADFPTRLTALTNLRTLYLDYTGFNSNALSGLDLTALSKLKSLRIDASFAAMEWPEYVQNLKQLERLDLAKTSINHVPDWLYSGHEKLWFGLSLDWSRFSHEAFKPAFEYVQNYSGPLGHLSDVHQMVSEYARGELTFLTGLPNFTDRPLQPEIMGLWNTPRTRLAAIEALSAEHAGVFRTFYQEPVSGLGLRKAQRTIESVSGHNAGVFHALEKSWRGAVRQRYGLPADVSVFELPDMGLQMSEMLRDGKIVQLPRLPAGSFSHVQTLRLGWLDAPVEQVRGFISAFSGTRTLEITSNGFTELPIAPGALPELTRLDLHNNHIAVTTAVQNQFNGLLNLEYLNLGNNPLGNLDVSALTRLKALNLRGTTLQAWPTGAEKLPKLSWLDLRDNELSSLSQEALSDEDALMKTQLTGNEFSTTGAAALEAARRRIETAKGLPEGTLERFAQEAVPAQFPPTETGWSIASHLLSLPERTPVTPGAGGFAERLQRLNPVMTGEQALKRIQQLRNDGMNDVHIDAQINTWHQTCESLTRQLNGWLYSREVPMRRAIVSSQARSLAALRLRDVWRERLLDGSGGAGKELSFNGLVTGDLPELVAQLPQVTRLDLSGVRMSAQGSNGFLNAFPQLKSLSINGNELSALPDAIQHMDQLERLELSGNQFSSLGPLYQRQGNERLRWIDLRQNILATFDCRPFSHLETLELGYNSLTQWPQGALEARHLRALDLTGNSITDVPEALLSGNHDELVAGTDMGDNLDLSLPTLERIRGYSDANGGGSVMGISREELNRRIEDPLSDDGSGSEDISDDSDDYDDDSDGDDRPDADATVRPVEPLYRPGLDTAAPALEPWLANTSTELAALRRDIWRRLAQEDNHERFFQLITLLRDTDEFRFVRADLTRRLWDVMDAAAENTELRELLFHNAETHGTCIDGRILTFSELEVRVYVYRALRDIPPGRPLQRGRALLQLSRQLFRLERVETIAEAAAQRRDRAEVRLRYRIGLAGGWEDGLELPGQPAHMAFDRPIRGQLLADTRASILAAERSDALLHSMVARDYWTEYLQERYPDEISAIEEALGEERLQQLSELEDRRANGAIADQEYEKDVVELGKQTQTRRTQKLIELSRRAIQALQALAGETEVPGTLSPQPGPSRRN
ncbi:hypothetical protein H7698_15865 [Pseudomonas sp. p50]|uniref:NEL-type E3 ubiquitin ligase domain-containing protein n=1 Tax=Pseudomonas sp. p50(2008) TaxID=2816832 RepID=UPI00188B43DC|nr:NEL-type E3 ubiquitin ligase domain-containing protein [Pseudomonas sp. p50(2008)]MBF4557555.1 hypothetical protein [Pseudomonas sp. p50(2008)]